MVSIQANLFKMYYQWQRRRSPATTEVDINQTRAEMEAIARLFRPLAKFESTAIEVDGMQAEWLTPQNVAGGRTILYLHGGYYLVGSIASHRNLAANIANAAQARALIIDYCLAPEHPFPAALECVLKAYDWMLRQGIQPEQVSFAGDSAGGGLVLTSLLALRERGMPLPACGVCQSPATDLKMSSESWRVNLRKEMVVDPTMARLIQPLYLRDVDPSNPLASPVYADLHGLPPLLIQVGSEEVLLSDSTTFAERARAAGVDVTLEVWPGMFHVWQFTAPMLPEAKRAIARIGEFIRSIQQKNEFSSERLAA